jgi:hypothetical protein
MLKGVIDCRNNASGSEEEPWLLLDGAWDFESRKKGMWIYTVRLYCDSDTILRHAALLSRSRDQLHDLVSQPKRYG